MAIFLNGDSRIIVQGITGSEGRKHARPDDRGRARQVVGGTNPRKAGQILELSGQQVPVFGTGGRGDGGDGRRRLGGVRATGRYQGRGDGGHRRRGCRWSS